MAYELKARKAKCKEKTAQSRPSLCHSREGGNPVVGCDFSHHFISKLEEKIARLEKNSGNSSKPPSSDIVKPKKTVVKVGRKKRKRGGQHGHRKFSRRPFEPEQVDEVIEYEFKDKDAKGLQQLDEWFIIPLCLKLIEQPDRLAIRVKTRHDLSVPLTSPAFLNASYHCGLEHEVSEPANKNYNYTL